MTDQRNSALLGNSSSKKPIEPSEQPGEQEPTVAYKPPSDLMIRPNSSPDLLELDIQARTPRGVNQNAVKFIAPVTGTGLVTLQFGDIKIEARKIPKKQDTHTSGLQGLPKPMPLNFSATMQVQPKIADDTLPTERLNESQPGSTQPLPSDQNPPGSEQDDKFKHPVPHERKETDPTPQDGRFNKNSSTSVLEGKIQVQKNTSETKTPKLTQPVEESKLEDEDPFELLTLTDLPQEPNLHVIDEETYDKLRKEAGNPYPEVFNRVLSELLAPLAPTYQEALKQLDKVLRECNQDLENSSRPQIRDREKLSEVERDIYAPPFEKFYLKIQQVKQIYSSFLPEELAAVDKILDKTQTEFASELKKIFYPDSERVIKASKQLVDAVLLQKPLFEKIFRERAEILKKAPEIFKARLLQQANELEGIAQHLTQAAQQLLDHFSKQKNQPEEKVPLLGDQNQTGTIADLSENTTQQPDAKTEIGSGIDDEDYEAVTSFTSGLDTEDWEAVKKDPEMEKMGATITSTLHVFKKIKELEALVASGAFKKEKKEKQEEVKLELSELKEAALSIQKDQKSYSKISKKLQEIAAKRSQKAQQTAAKFKQPTSQTESKEPSTEHTYHDECTCVSNHKEAILKLRPGIQETTDFEVKEIKNEVTLTWNRADEPPTPEEINRELDSWCPKCVRDNLFLMLDPDIAFSSEPGKAPEKSNKELAIRYGFAALSSIFNAIFAFMGPSGKQPSELVDAWNALNVGQRALAILYGFSSETINTFLTADFSDKTKKAWETIQNACANMFTGWSAFGYGVKNIGELIFAGSAALAALALGIDSLKWLKPAMAGKGDIAADAAEGLAITGGILNLIVTFVSRYIGLISLLDLIVNQFKTSTKIKEDILSKLSRIDEKYLPKIERFLQDKKITEENITLLLEFLDTLPQDAIREFNWFGLDGAKKFLDMIYDLGALTSSLCAWGVFGQKAINAMSMISDFKSKPAWAQGITSAFPGLPSFGLYASGFYKFKLFSLQRLAYIFKESTTPIKDFGKLLAQYFFPGASSFSVGVMAKGVRDQPDGYAHDILSQKPISDFFPIAAQGGAVAVNTPPLLDPKGVIPLPTTWREQDPKLPTVIRHIGVEGISEKTMKAKRAKGISFFRDMPKDGPIEYKQIKVVRKP